MFDRMGLQEAGELYRSEVPAVVAYEDLRATNAVEQV